MGQERDIVSHKQIYFSNLGNPLLVKGLIDMILYKCNKKHSYTCFIDISSAFDNAGMRG